MKWFTIVGLYKTRWVERHSCLKTFGELYQHVATCLDAMVNPHVCPEVNESGWNWDSDTKTKAHGSKCNQQSFGVELHEAINILNMIVSFSEICTLK